MAKITGTHGNYAVRFWYNDGSGKQKSKYRSGFEKKADAEKWAEKEKDKLERRNYGMSGGMSDIINAAMKEKALMGLAYYTAKKYAYHAEIIRAHFGNTDISEIKKKDIIDFLEKVKYIERKSGDKTILVEAPEKMKYVKKILSIVFNYAMSEELTTYNPMQFVRLPRSDVKYTVYTAIQARALLSHLKAKNTFLYTVSLLALFFGLRRGEICALKKTDIQNGVLHVMRSVYRNREEDKLVEKDVKTKSGRRRLPAPVRLRDELMWFQNTNNIESEYIACLHNGDQCDPDGVTERFKRFLADNKLPKIKLHELRHTFAAISLEAKTDLDTLKRAMGHASVDITSNTYLHDDLDLISEQIDTVTTILLQ